VHRFAIALDPSTYSRISGIAARLHIHAPEMPATLSIRQREDNAKRERIGVKGRFPLTVK